MGRIVYLVVFLSILQGGDALFKPEDFRKREVVAIRLDEPLRIDGLLTEPIYLTPPNQTFIQIDPDNGAPASEDTDVWVAYDDEALYILARLWDSQPDSIVARMGRRDADFNSDLFQVIIDAYNDKRSGFFFIINPSGAIQDGTFSNDSRGDDSWDGVWEGRTSIDEDGWTAELRIPYSQLRFNREDEYTWGILFGRLIQRRNEQALFTYIRRGERGMVSHAATLRGIRNIQPPVRREFTPYISSGYSLLPSTKDNTFFNGRDSNLGLGTDIKLGIGSNLTLDATLNPDFGQVEVDPSVINLSAYETFFDEKRPFFIEGASIFSFGRGGPTNRWGFNFSSPSFFYSRRIGQSPRGGVDTAGDVDRPSATSILGAAKLSGKLKNGWSVGGLTTITRRESARIYENGQIRSVEVEPLATYNLLRAQKDFNDGLQGLGIIGSYVYRDYDDPALRDVLNDQAVGLGVDGWTFLNKNKDWALGWWGGMTSVSGSTDRMLSLQQNSSHYFQRPDADHVSVDSALTRMTGYSGRILLNRETGHFMANAALGFVSPGFESNDLGRTTNTDLINMHVGGGYRWYDPGEVFRNLGFITAYASNHDFSGIKTHEILFLNSWAQLLNYWNFDANLFYIPRTLSDNQLRGGPRVVNPERAAINFNVNSDSRKDFAFGFGLNRGRGAGGDNTDVWANVNLKVGSRLSLETGPEYSSRREVAQFVDRIDDVDATVMYGKRYVVAALNLQTVSANVRLNYTFTPRLSFQAYFQPYLSVGEYSEFKEFKRPESYDFLIYGEEGSTIIQKDGEYIIDPTGGDDSDVFTISNPDFNYKALVGTAVLRWEFSPGSTLYLVWTRNGSDDRYPGDFQLGRDLSDLFLAPADNIFVVKAVYWLGR